MFAGGEAEAGRTHAERKANSTISFVSFPGQVGVQFQGDHFS